MTHFQKNTINIKKLLICVILFATAISYADNNESKEFLNDVNKSIILDVNSTQKEVVIQLQPNIMNHNINAINDEILIEGNASENLDLEIVFLFDDLERKVISKTTDENGYWSLSNSFLEKELLDGKYEIYVSTKDYYNNKSKITSVKNLKRDRSIHGILQFNDGNTIKSDAFINKKELKSFYIFGEIDTDTHIVDVVLFNENDVNNTQIIEPKKVTVGSDGKINIATKNVPLQKLEDGVIIVQMDIEDNHQNKLLLQAKIVKDTVNPLKPIIEKSVKNNNMIFGTVSNLLVYFGSAEMKSQIKIKMYNVKYKKAYVNTIVKTDTASKWTIVGKDLTIKDIKHGKIESVLTQVDEAGNESEPLIVRSFKEINSIFPDVIEPILSENYMAVHTIKDLEDVVKSIVVNDQYIIAGSYELIYFFDKKKAKLKKQIEIKKNWINTLKIHNDLLFIGLSNGDIQIRNIQSKKLIRTLHAHKTPILNIIIDSTNKYIISSSNDGDIVVWDIQTNKKIHNLRKHQWDVAAMTTMNGKIYTGSDDYSINIWDIQTGKLLDSLKSAHNGTINSLVIYNDILISAADDNMIHLRDLKTGKLIKTLKGHRKGVTKLVINHNTLISTSKDRTIILWNLDTFQKEKQLRGHSKAIVSLAVNDENIITGALDYKIRVWGYDLSLQGTGEIDETVLSKYNLIKSLAISKDEITHLAQTENEIVFSTKGHINFYNNVTYKYTRDYSTLDKVIFISKKEKESNQDTEEDSWEEEEPETNKDDGWTSEDEDDSEGVSIWEDRIERIKLQREKEANSKPQWVNTINIEGVKLIAGLGYKHLKIWDLERNKATLLVEGHDSSILNINRADGVIISSSSDGVVKVWNDETMELLISIDAHQWGVRSAVVDDGKLYTGSDDYSIKIWDMDTADLLDTIKSAHNAEITKLLIHENFLISSGKDGKIIYRDKQTNKIVYMLNAHDSSINTMIQDEEHLISGSDDTSIKVWDIKTAKLIKTMQNAHSIGVSALMVTDDYIISGGKDKKINIWKYYE